MSVDYLNCNNCGEVFDDCEPIFICEGCDKYFCVYCNNSVSLSTNENGETISCEYCVRQNKFKEEMKKYPEIIIDSGLVIFNSKLFEIKFNLKELEEYSIKDNEFNFKLINNTEGSVFLTKIIF